jgi:DNA polymerase-1
LTKPGWTVFGKRGGRWVEREIVIPEPGHVILTCDLSQIDMRGVAGHCQDSLYMSMFEVGKDMHQEIANMMGVSRDAAKPLNHGYNYGMGAKAMIKDGHNPELVRKFFDVMSRFTVKDTWTDSIRTRAADGELLDNGFGRMMRCDPNYAYTVGPALMGQGSARDLTMEVLLRLMRRHPEYAEYLRIFVHDEFVFSVPEDQAERIGRDIKDAFTWQWRGVPILCDLTPPSVNWGRAGK